MMKKKMKSETCLWIVIFFILTIMIGNRLNLTALLSNDRRMPVKTQDYMDTQLHFSYQKDSEVNYPFLTDRIKLGNRHHSIGDFLLYFGFIGACFFLIKNVNIKWRQDENIQT